MNNDFKSDFYLKPINVITRSGPATWPKSAEIAVYDLMNDDRKEPVYYSRQRNFDGKYQDCKVEKINGQLFMFPGDGSKYTVTHTSRNNIITDETTDETEKACVICMNYIKNHVAVPCGHLITCTQCTHKMEEMDHRCPICKVPYTQLMKIFF